MVSDDFLYVVTFKKEGKRTGKVGVYFLAGE